MIVAAARLRRRWRSLLVGAALAAIAVAAAWLLLGGDGRGYVVEAAFDDVRGIRKNSDVKVAGVPGGEVEAVEVTRGDRAVVRMELSPSAAPIGRGASARVRPVNLLGEVYVDLDPGDQRRPRPSGARIPAARTGAPVELDDLLNVLDPDTRARLRLLINEAGIALMGRGTDLNALLAELPGSIDRLRALLAELEGENRTMAALVEEGDRVLAPLNRRRDDLGALVDSAGAALETTARRREELGATVAAAPAALRQLRGTLARLGAAATALRPLGRDLERAARPLAATLRELPGFASASRPALRTATEVAPSLRRLGRGATPPVRRLRPSADLLTGFSVDLAPLLRTLDEGGMTRFLSMADYLGKVQRSSDGLGHLFRLHGVLNGDLLRSAIGRYGPPQG